MPILIAYLGGMLTLLSPCTLPVIPLLFAGAGSNKRHFAALLRGDDLLFHVIAKRVADGLFFRLGDKHPAVRTVPGRNLVPPPELS